MLLFLRKYQNLKVKDFEIILIWNQVVLLKLIGPYWLL